jgi:hypothetical protein
MNIKNKIIALTLLFLLGSGLAVAADFKKGRQAAKTGDWKTALAELTPLAVQGNADAQVILGVMYVFGRGVPENDKTAVKWYTLAAEQGHAKGQYNLGYMYDNGRGVPENDKTAVKWFTLAAEQGNADARSQLEIMAEKGSLYAQRTLDDMSDNGEGAEQEVFRAFSCSVVEQGNRKMSMAFCSGLIDTQLELSGFKANHPNRLALKDNVSAYKRIDKQCGYTNFYGSGNTFADEFETGGLDPTLAFIAYSADPSAANLKKAQNPTFHKGCMGIFKNHMDDINHLSGLK